MEEKRLTRSTSDRMVAGVCGGLADYFKLDPSLVRIGIVLIGVITAVVPVCLIYGVLWLVIPETK
ncbi:MAG: PspC domain-containing protein [Cyclobacteriaceae bacterium]|nr:PspC domain-containing protein [Cyclobacteriaceae bacterium]